MRVVTSQVPHLSGYSNLLVLGRWGVTNGASSMLIGDHAEMSIVEANSSFHGLDRRQQLKHKPMKSSAEIAKMHSL